MNQSNLNYWKLNAPSLLYYHYAFIDTEKYFADQLFIKNKVNVSFGKEYKRENSPYIIIFCKIKKKDEKNFLTALSELKNKMILLGYIDYEKVCKELMKSFVK